MEKTKEVCAKCMGDNWMAGELDNEIWCDDCDEWVNKTITVVVLAEEGDDPQ